MFFRNTFEILCHVFDPVPPIVIVLDRQHADDFVITGGGFEAEFRFETDLLSKAVSMRNAPGCHSTQPGRGDGLRSR